MTLYILMVRQLINLLDEDYVKQIQEGVYTGLFTSDFTITLGEDEYFCMEITDHVQLIQGCMGHLIRRRLFLKIFSLFIL